MKTLALAALAGLIALPAFAQDAPAAPAPAPAPAPAAAQPKFSAKTSLLTLYRTESTKAVLAKHMPDVLPILDMYIDQVPEEMTLEVLHQQYGDQIGLTKEVLDATNADLVKIS